MKLKGEDTVEAILEWFKEEIKKGSTAGPELGKFFFGVSTGTVAGLVAFKKLEKNLELDWPVGCSLLLLSSSTLVALFMIIPRIRPMAGDSDLFDEYTKQLRRMVRFVWVWFGFWAAGVVAGLCALFSP